MRNKKNNRNNNHNDDDNDNEKLVEDDDDEEVLENLANVKKGGCRSYNFTIVNEDDGTSAAIRNDFQYVKIQENINKLGIGTTYSATIYIHIHNVFGVYIR